MATENNISLVPPPPAHHCIHSMCHSSFFGALKERYSREIQRFMLQNPGQRVTQCEISRLFGAAYLASASAEKALNGFRACVISPLDPAVFDKLEPTENLPGDSLQCGEAADEV